MWAAVDNRPLTSTKFAASSRNSTPLISSGGRPAANRSSITQDVKVSHVAGSASLMPLATFKRRRSPSGICGAMRSTMLFGKVTCSSSQAARSGSTASAKPTTALRLASPFRARLSHDMTVSGPAPVRRRSLRPATM